MVNRVGVQFSIVSYGEAYWDTADVRERVGEIRLAELGRSYRYSGFPSLASSESSTRARVGAASSPSCVVFERIPYETVSI